MFTVYYDFTIKGKPLGSSTKTKIFINNSTILADKLIYEYVTLKWRGSSDSKISQNIRNFSSLPDKFDFVPDQNWLTLLKEINNNFKIEENNISFVIAKTLIYHIYSCHMLMGDNMRSIDVDHIIPQSLFDSSSIVNAHNIKNALFNLCPLPSKDNISKTNKKLKLIDDVWLIQQIEKYSQINKAQFLNFSEVINWEDLRSYRRSFFEEEFINARIDLFN